MKMTPQYFLFWLFCERFDHNTVDSLLYRVPISAIQLFYIKLSEYQIVNVKFLS